MSSIPVKLTDRRGRTDSAHRQSRQCSERLSRREGCSPRRPTELEVTTCETFAPPEDTATAFRAWLHDDVGLGQRGADKVQAAKVVAAWEAAVGRTTSQRQQDAEQRTAGIPAAISGGTYICTRCAFEEQPSKTPNPSEQMMRGSSRHSFLEKSRARKGRLRHSSDAEE